MKKFSKLLTVLLALVVIITAFTVVALASEEPELTAKEINSSTGKFSDGTFSSFTPGDIFQNAIWNDANKTGVWNVHGADNGNVYLQSEYDVGGSGAHDNLDMYFNYNKSTNIDAYPYIAFDLDIMTENGTFGQYASIGATVSANSSASRIDMSSTYIYELGLDTTPYNWQHLTYLVEHVGGGIFNHHFFVNGKLTYTRPTDYSASSGLTAAGDTSNLALYFFRMYPSIHNTTAGNGKIGYDNFRYTLFPAGYCDDENGKADLSKIGNHYYSEDYEFPYGITEAKVGDNIYDDANEAIEAAAEGATVKLTMNGTKTLIIDKNILLDTNVYDESGNATGSFYTYEYKSSKGFVPTETAAGSGIYSFERSANAVDVIWDEKCAEDCDCFAEYGGHTLTAETVALVGNVPEYFGTLPTWEITNEYTQKKFLGWSYENDGTVDELIAVTAEDVENGQIKLYPVYTTVAYSIELISGGISTFHVESEFGALLTDAPAGATIKLLSDIYTEVATVQIKKSLTIDLNGYDLKRCFVYGNVYEATDSGEGLVYGTDTVLETVASGGEIFFRPMATYVKLTFTSSTGGGTIYNFKMDAETWKYNGEVVKRTSTAIAPARLTNASESTYSASYFELHINGGITIYAGQAFYSIYASGTGYVIKMDNVNYYKLDNSDFIYCRTNYKVDISITNSLIYAPNNSGNFMFLGTNDGKTYGSERYSEILIKDCDIIKASTGWGFYLYNARYAGTTNAVFDNCRLYDSGAESTTACDAEVTGINGTLCYYSTASSNQSTPVNTQEGWSLETVSIPVTYYVPSATFEVTTDLINAPTFDIPASTKHTITYNRLITQPVDVNWVNADGIVIKTEKLTPGVDAPVGPDAAVELPDDPYRNLKAIWVDAAEDGKALPETLGWNSEGTEFTWQNAYSFYAVGELDGNKTYVGGIKDAMFNISFLASFRYNIYFPVNDVLNITSVEGFTDCGTVSIDGEKHRLFNFSAGTTSATEDTAVLVSFTVGEEAFEQTFKLSAVRYAEMILASNTTAESELLAIGNMVRFLKEARLFCGLEVEEKLDTIISAAGVPDYAESYNGDTNISGLTNYIYSVSYVIYNGVASYKFTLNDPAYADIISFYHGDNKIGSKVGGTDEVTVNSEPVVKTYVILDVMRVYDIIDELTIKIDDTELSATYSILDYIEAKPDSALVKSLYEFGVAAENYKTYLEGEYPTA